MKNCPNCNSMLEDNAAFCGNCGAMFGNPQQGAGAGYQGNPQQGGVGYQGNPQQRGAGYQGNPQYQQGSYAYVQDPYDHTGEFSPKDISDNKVISMLPYLLGTVGIIVALLASNTSSYVAFHVRQALKFTVINVLVGFITLILFWTFIVPIAAGIFTMVLFVVKIICFFSICNGKAKEPAIIRNFKFLR